VAAHLLGDDLGGKAACIEAWLVDVGLLVGNTWPAKLSAGDAVC
jgi:hypothetical protein